MALFRDEAPVLDATKTKFDDLAQVASSGEYAAFYGSHATVGVDFMSFPITASTVSTALVTLPYPIVVVGAVSRFETASSSGTWDLEFTPSGTAVGSGTAILTGTVALSGTAATNSFGTLATVAGGAVGYPGVTVPVGNSVSLIIAGTMTSLVGACITIFYTRAPI
jgi:hypothetical protein